MIPLRLICFYRLPVSVLAFPLHYSRYHGLFCCLKLVYMIYVLLLVDYFWVKCSMDYN